MNVIRNKKGFTLVEMIVSFALIAIFMTASVGVASGAARVYTRINNVSRAQTVADMLGETIAGELSRSSAFGKQESDTVITVQNGRVEYKDSENRTCVMYVNSRGYLQIDYPNVEVTGGEGTANWQYGENTYLRNKITVFKVTPVSGRNLLRAEIELTSTVTGFSYQTVKMIECYNVLPGQIQAGSGS